jgi:GT2 family glycosyltransferase
MAAVSIITPWRDHPELIADYERSVAGAQIVVVDNASVRDHAQLVRDMVQRLGGVYLRNEQNRGFAAANNQGLEHARGDVVLFLNDDIIAAPGFIDTVAVETDDRELVGPSLQRVLVYGIWLPYLEGWCVAGRRSVWNQLGGWDAAAYPDVYWEDTDLCLRATEAGLRLRQREWPIQHKGGQTTQSLLRWGEVYERNRATFAARVKPLYERLRREQGP